jgi:hypothetical protein
MVNDNTNNGAAFKPFPDQGFILQGKINSNGNDSRIVLVKDATKSGKKIIEVYEKVGVLFVNEKKQTESAPDFTGSFKERRLAAWKKSKDGNNYMSLSVSDAQQQQGASQQYNPNDIIPF